MKTRKVKNFKFKREPVRPGRNRGGVGREKGSYTGEVIDGIPNGKGKCVWDKGDSQWETVYEGDWVDGKMHGHGKYTTREDIGFGRNWSYEGDFVNDKFEGHGVRTSPNGWVFEGEWKDDLENGLGIFTRKDGSVQKGIWLEGKANGLGTYYDASEEWSYEGNFKDDLFDGYGEKIWKDGRFYKGEWKKHSFEGKGEYKSHEGTWNGDWKWGKIYGEGKWTSAEKGFVYTGTWNEYQGCGKGKLVFANGDIYEGEVHLGYGCGHIDMMSMHGKGVYTYRGGKVYKGGFKDGRRKDEVEAERAIAAATKEKERIKAEKEYKKIKKQELEQRRKSLTKEDIELKKRLEKECKALYGEEKNIKKRYEILKNAFFAAHNSGYTDSMAWEASMGTESSQLSFWQTACDLKWEVEKLCEYYELEVEEE